MNPGCPKEEELARYVSGACGSEEAASLGAHAQECAHCARWLAEAEADEAILAGVRQALDAQEHDLKAHEPARLFTHETVALPPDAIGGYEIREKIGRGGMGAVYRALQTATQREVALKVVSAGVASRQLLRRFEQEAHILGRLDHIGIARIFEAGTFDMGNGGQPFFAMEYVDGLPLSVYAEHNQLGTRERLEIIAKIGEALQHAHERGIIHRDLKPGNVLVTKGGEPKILDFGVARATDADVQMTTLHTDIGQLVGTIPYMSPEQVAGDPTALDQRSDVYGLGVMAYELLAGRLPHAIEGKMIHEAVRVIREDDPTPISTINRVFRGDIEIIIGKALEKEVGRRYQSAGEFAQDVRRHLANQPIVARPPSTWYQISRFARRNRGVTAGIVGVFVVLVAGIVVSFYFAVGELEARREAVAARALAEAQRVRAETELAKARQVAAFTQRMLSAIDPEVAGELDTTLIRMVLDKASAQIETELADNPEVEAEIRRTIGNTYTAIGKYAPAAQHLETALDISRRVLGEEHADTLISMNDLAALYLTQGRHADAEPLFVRVSEACPRVLGAEHPTTLEALSNLAGLYLAQGRHAEAEPLFSRTLQGQKVAFGEEHPETIVTMANLGELYRREGRVEEAERLLTGALDCRRRVSGEQHPGTLQLMTQVGVLYASQDRFDEAEELLARAVELQKRVLGEEHRDTLGSMSNLAGMYVARAQYDRAEPLLIQVMDIQKRVLGEQHLDTIFSTNTLAVAYLKQGAYDKAEPLFAEAVANARKALPPDHMYVGVFLDYQAWNLAQKESYPEAERAQREAYTIFRAALGTDHQRTVDAIQSLIDLYEAWGKPDRAAKWRQKLPNESTSETTQQTANPPRD